jgi:hypothetical protein
MDTLISYLDCHEAGLCCYLVIHIENLLRPLQLLYFHLRPIYRLSLIAINNEFKQNYLYSADISFSTSATHWIIFANTCVLTSNRKLSVIRLNISYVFKHVSEPRNVRSRMQPEAIMCEARTRPLELFNSGRLLKYWSASMHLRQRAQ